MSEFDNELDFLNEPLEEPESLEAPKVKVKAPKKSRAKKLAPLDTSSTFLDEQLLEECKPVPKKGKGRPKKPLPLVETDDDEPTPPKPKRVQTEAQKANFAKALAKRQENIALRKAAKELEKQVKEAELETKKKEVERKVIKKAVCLKKKEILSQAALDDISDEEIPDEIVEKIIKKQRAKSAPKVKPVASEPVPQSKYNFV